MYTFPIVGSVYRPPAKAILEVIPLGTPLLVKAEPTNEHDPYAVAVWIETKEIPENLHEDLDQAGQQYGYCIEEIRDSPKWHLGYIPREQALNFQPLLKSHDATAKLGFSPTGKPTVQVELKAKISEDALKTE